MMVTIPSSAPNLNTPRVPLPFKIREMERVLEAETRRDTEVVVLLNHWGYRQIYVGDPTITFRTPLFDLWYDHLIEEGIASGQVVSGAGGGMGFGGGTGPAPGTSPQEAYRWQNHVFDYTVKFVTTLVAISAATVTMVCGMNLQATDEPVTTSTITIINDIAKSDQTVFLSGRTPMRFVQWRWSITRNDGIGFNQDVIQQIAVRKT